jgi:hypothetical protein
MSTTFALFGSVSFDFILSRPTDMPLKNPKKEEKNVTKAMNRATIGDAISANTHTDKLNNANFMIVL